MVGLFGFLVLISINDLTTNELSRLLIILIREISIVLVVCTIGVLFSLRKVHLNQLTAVALYTSLVAYGIALSALNGASELGLQGMPINLLVTISGIVLISRQSNKILPDSFSKYYLIYVLVGLCMTIAIGGLDPSFPPHFVFDYSSALYSSEILYSQGVSQYFGYGALAAALLLAKSESRFRSILLMACVLLMLALSFLGGGRGDSIASAVVTLGYLAFQFRTKFLITVLVTGLFLLLYIEDWSYILDSFFIFQRLLEVIGGYYGSRDQLLGQVLNLLSIEPRCLVVGCGFGYFQYFYGFEVSLYPHNFLAESLIVFGIPISAIFGIMVLGGVRDYYRKIGSMDLFLLFFALSILVAMKSGSLFGGWFVTTSSVYFASIFFSRLTGRWTKGVRRMQ